MIHHKYLCEQIEAVRSAEPPPVEATGVFLAFVATSRARRGRPSLFHLFTFPRRSPAAPS